jgi:fused signal recognition particle receptor
MSKFLHNLTNIISNTSNKISNSIEDLFNKKKLTQEYLNILEELLLCADVGVNMSYKIISILKKQKFNKTISSDKIKEELSIIITHILDQQDHSFSIDSNDLNVILVSGVNGNGKTTTIGKLASWFIKQRKRVTIAPCDTFRAAAIEQVNQWAIRSGATLLQGKPNTDPASIAYQSITTSRKNRSDILLLDTAGRLHNQKNLMEELAKMVKVIKKIHHSSPYHSLLTIDSNTGQNAVNQVKEFQASIDISGLIITKLDGSARAGTIINIVQKFSLPIHFIGIGENINDLKPFVSHEFAKALVGI